MKKLIESVSRRLAAMGRTVPEQEIKRAYWRHTGCRRSIGGMPVEIQTHEIINYLNVNNISKRINQNQI